MSYETLLLSRAESDPRTVVLTAENRAAIRNLPAQLGARFIDVGICEQTMIGVAAGLALRGRRPICHALASFLCYRAYEFIRDDIGIAGLPVILVGGVPGFLSDANGPTHQAIEDIGLMRTIPNMVVATPADASELEGAMSALFDVAGPSYLRHYAGPSVIEHKTPFRVGKAERLRDGKDVTILTYGFLLKEAVVARELLQATNLSVRLVDIRTPCPLDQDEVLSAARETSLVVTLEDHLSHSGLYGMVAECLVENRTLARVLPIGLSTFFKPALIDDVLRAERFTGQAIAHRIAQELERIKETKRHA